MSKPIVRVVFSALIALALVIGIYTSVQGAILDVSTKSSQVYMNNDAKLGTLHNKSSSQSLDVPAAGQTESNSATKDGGCNHDSIISPEDY